MRDSWGVDMTHLVQSPPTYPLLPPNPSEPGVNGVYTIIGKASDLANSYAASVSGNAEMGQPYSIDIVIECTAILQIDACGHETVDCAQALYS